MSFAGPVFFDASIPYDRPECPRCGGRVHSSEWDGYCYHCATRPEIIADPEARARNLTERMLLTIRDERAPLSVVYQSAVWAAHAARML